MNRTAPCMPWIVLVLVPFLVLATGCENRLRYGAPPGSPGTPTPPSELQVTVTGDREVRLSWVDNSADETGFVVRRGSDGQLSALLPYLDRDVTGYVDAGLGYDKEYSYVVYARNDRGESPGSNLVKVRLSPPAMGAELPGMEILVEGEGVTVTEATDRFLVPTGQSVLPDGRILLVADVAIGHPSVGFGLGGSERTVVALPGEIPVAAGADQPVEFTLDLLRGCYSVRLAGILLAEDTPFHITLVARLREREEPGTP